MAVARRVASRSVMVLCILVPTTVLVSLIDRGADAWPLGTVAALLGPVCLAIGAAWGLAELSSEGAWDAALGLGHSPRRLVLGVWILGAALGALSLGAPGPDPATGIGEVAPIPAGVDAWWSGTAWDSVDARWQSSPASLSLLELLDRLTMAPPRGAAWRVDRGELVRRAGWALGFVWAAFAGAWSGIVSSPGRGTAERSMRAAAIAFALEGLWLVLVLAGSAYASASIT